jgi:hypothetical protein
MKPCKCGKSPRIGAITERGFYVECQGTEYCWSGPLRDTEEEAEAAWDELMDGEEPNRKPIAVSICSIGKTLYSLRDDGAIFWTSDTVKGWRLHDPVPGTEAGK